MIQRFELVEKQTPVNQDSSDAAAIALTLQGLGFTDPSADFSPADSNNPSRSTAGDSARRQRLQGIFTEIIGQCRDSVSPLSVAYLGPEGTFTQAATFKYFGSSTDTRSFTDIDEVFRAVETSVCQLGVVPVENSIEGTINRTLDRIIDSPLDYVVKRCCVSSITCLARRARCRMCVVFMHILRPWHNVVSG